MDSGGTNSVSRKDTRWAKFQFSWVRDGSDLFTILLCCTLRGTEAGISTELNEQYKFWCISYPLYIVLLYAVCTFKIIMLSFRKIIPPMNWWYSHPSPPPTHPLDPSPPLVVGHSSIIIDIMSHLMDLMQERWLGYCFDHSLLLVLFMFRKRFCILSKLSWII